MKDNIKFFIALFIITGLIFACGNSDKSDSNKNKVKETPKTTYEKGMDELQKGNYTQSLEILSTIKKKDKDYNNAQSKINYIKGVQLFNLGKNSEAIEYFEAVDKNDIYFSEAIKYLKKIDYDLNKYDIAVELLNNNNSDSALQIFKSIPSSDENYKFSISKINYIKGKNYLSKDIKDSAIMLLKLVDTLDIFYKESDSIVKAQIYLIEENNQITIKRNYIIGSIIFISLLLITFLIIRKKRISKKQSSFKELLSKLLLSTDWNILKYSDVLKLAQNCKLNSKNKVFLNEIEESYKFFLSLCLEDDVSLTDGVIHRMQELQKILNIDYSTIDRIKKDIGCKYFEKLLNKFFIDNILTDNENNDLVKAKSFFNLDINTTNSLFTKFTQDKYKKTIQEVLRDGKITVEERELLNHLKSTLSINVEFAETELKQEEYKKLSWEVDKLIFGDDNISNDKIKNIISFAKNIDLDLLKYPELLRKIFTKIIQQLFSDIVITNDKLEKLNSFSVLLKIDKKTSEKIFNNFAINKFEGLSKDFIANQSSVKGDISKLITFLKDFKIDINDIQSNLKADIFKKFVKLLIKDHIFDENKKSEFEKIRKVLNINNDNAKLIYKDVALTYVHNYASAMLADSLVSDKKLMAFNKILDNLDINTEDMDKNLLHKIERSNYEYAINYGEIPILNVKFPNFRLEQKESLYAGIDAVYYEKKSSEPDFITMEQGKCLLTDKRILIIGGKSIYYREIERWETQGNKIDIILRGARKSDIIRRFELYNETIDHHIKYIKIIFNRIMKEGNN